MENKSNKFQLVITDAEKQRLLELVHELFRKAVDNFYMEVSNGNKDYIAIIRPENSK